MLKNYFKLTFKLLKRNKLFSIITILGMTIPLMFLMIIISVISHFASKNAPESNFDKVICLESIKYSIERPNSMSGNMVMQPTFDFIKNHVKTMKTPDKVGIVSGMEFYNLYVNNKKTTLKAVYTDEVFWEIADFKFIEGRAFNSSETKNSQLLAVIDESTKKLVFGNENALGKTMKIFRKQFTIIGVVKNVDISRQRTHSNIWLPITTSDKYMIKDIYGSGCTCLLKAKTKEQLPKLEAEFAQIINNFHIGSYEGLTKIEGELTSVEFNKKLKTTLNDLLSVRIDEDYVIYLAFIVIFFFFIILPSINLLYIQSSRINERSSEIGVRKSFGSSKKMLSRQFIVENITISLFSGIIGLVFTLLFFFAINYSQIIPGLHLSINLNSILICLALWMLFGVSTGLLPAIRMSRVGIIDALNQEEMHKNFTLLARRIKRIKIILVIEFALTFFSMVVILTFVYRFQKNNSYPLGFNYKDVYQVSVSKYDEQGQGMFGETLGNDEIFDFIKASSFVKNYGNWHWNEPYHDGYTTIMGGIKYKGKQEKDEIYLTIAGAEMDKVFGLKLINGRWFDKSDDRPDYHPLVINQACKTRIFKDKNAIGEYIDISGNNCQIIGVIDNYKYHGEFSTPIEIIFSRTDLNNLGINCWSRTITDFFKVKPETKIEDINSMARVLTQKYPDYEINITSIDSVRDKYINKTLGPIAIIIIVFFLILLIVLLGLFGVLWYDISLRKSEIGLRRATGASSSRIFKLIVKEMLLWASIGMIIGLIFYLQLPVLDLFSIDSGIGLSAIISATLIIYALVIICSLIPASQAAKIQPATALYEQ